MAKLREGLIDPKEIPEQDLPNYVATTYGGYFEEIQNRLWDIDKFLKICPSHWKTSFNTETIAVQLRSCCELIAYAIGDFDQISHGIVSKSKRTTNDVEKVLKVRGDKDVWPLPIDPSWTGDVLTDDENLVPNVKVTGLESAKHLKELEGRIGNLLHAVRRPRPDGDGRMTLDELIQAIRRIKVFSDRHIVFDQAGDGWFLDSRMAFRQATNAAPLTTVVRCSSCEHLRAVT